VARGKWVAKASGKLSELLVGLGGFQLVDRYVLRVTGDIRQ